MADFITEGLILNLKKINIIYFFEKKGGNYKKGVSCFLDTCVNFSRHPKSATNHCHCNKVGQNGTGKLSPLSIYRNQIQKYVSELIKNHLSDIRTIHDRKIKKVGRL